MHRQKCQTADKRLNAQRLRHCCWECQRPWITIITDHNHLRMLGGDIVKTPCSCRRRSLSRRMQKAKPTVD